MRLANLILVSGKQKNLVCWLGKLEVSKVPLLAVYLRYLVKVAVLALQVVAMIQVSEVRQGVEYSSTKEQRHCWLVPWLSCLCKMGKRAILVDLVKESLTMTKEQVVVVVQTHLRLRVADSVAVEVDSLFVFVVFAVFIVGNVCCLFLRLNQRISFELRCWITCTFPIFANPFSFETLVEVGGVLCSKATRSSPFHFFSLLKIAFQPLVR